jgi:protein-L-isoaspartate(D-aspartate) O-methyltransferase
MRKKIVRIFVIAVLAGAIVLGILPYVRHGFSQQEVYADLHDQLINEVREMGVQDDATLAAMRSVPRHLFVPLPFRLAAYENRPLPIGEGQTISQPYIVALMTELARADKNSSVLEIGTGSGYQAAILSVLADKVYTIEYLEPLGLEAKKRLQELGYGNVEVKIGDGYKGWPEHAPFDAILVTASIDHVPQPLIDQLKPGGRLVIPMDNHESKNLLLITKDETGTVLKKDIIPVMFVPFLGPRQ